MKSKKEMKIHKLISPAKINLNLKVIKFDKNLQKHKLSSQIAIIKLHDVIEIKPSNDLSVIYRDTNKKKIFVKNDIIKKTIKYFDKKYKKKSKFNILVDKKIPIGYGIGGGSSNAASILKYLYKFYKINSKNFFDDAPELGSDVLLFFNQTPKIIDGIKSYRILNKNKARWKKIYLIFPRTKNLTASIFSHFRKNSISEKTTKNPFRNDLLRSSLAVNPEFFDIYSMILSEKKKFSFFGMSGSGSSIFFNFDKISSERSVIQLIKQKFPLVRIEKSYYFG
jgi:4-diphosphocytidyl-2-C-methyl-D-erythritol kinase